MARPTHEREIISYVDSIDMDVSDIRQIIQEDLSLGDKGVAEALILIENKVGFIRQSMINREDNA